MRKSSPAWSFKGKHQRAFSSDAPGPGAYTPSNYSFQASPNYGMGTSFRLQLKTKDQSPGPGTYTPLNSWRKTARTVFGKSKRNAYKGSSSTPGPGYYKTDGNAKGPSYSLKGKNYKISLEQVPGPGTYDPKIEALKEQNLTVKIGKAKREIFYSDDYSPGPGTYTVSQEEKGIKWRFGTEKKNHLKRSSSPGPGSYNSHFSNSSAKFSMSPRRPMTSGSKENPGPGAYSPRVVSSSPKFSLGKSERDKFNKTCIMPGPNAYSPRIENNKGIRIGKSKRNFNDSSTETPGPGAYNPKPQKGSPEYSLRTKYTAKMEIGPGPGIYDPKLAYVKENSPAWRVSKTKKNWEKTKELVPGPGSYDNKATLSGPKWGFGTSRRNDLKISDVPGPGDYDIKPLIPDVPHYLMSESSSLSRGY
ncbi:ODF3L2_1 [Blepharisma stoltei]|uniref:Uncharacterized protein n=1 Tax=Blepharisma stoltei TaxID=1481888 RepID=A0AAU9I744_9CILI|nr:unnamed protein product [Blepharisma stoltei]